MKPKLNRRWILLVGAAAALLALLAFLFAPRPIAVDAVAVVRGPIAESVADQGTMRLRDAYQVSAPVAGRLERIALKVGDAVVRGETRIARIRPAASDFLDPRSRAQAQAQIAAARAEFDRARAQASEAESQRARANAV